MRSRARPSSPRSRSSRRTSRHVACFTSIQRIEAYARHYGRPAYYLDSVMAHLDSADAKLVSGLRTDLWGKPVYYFWTWCYFTLSSHAGWTNQPGAPWHWVTERYPCPRGRPGL